MVVPDTVTGAPPSASDSAFSASARLGAILALGKQQLHARFECGVFGQDAQDSGGLKLIPHAFVCEGKLVAADRVAKIVAHGGHYR